MISAGMAPLSTTRRPGAQKSVPAPPTMSYATEKSLITVEVPASLAGRYKVVPKNLDSTMTFDAATERNGNVTYSVRSEGRLPYRHESEVPSASIDAPQLVVTGVFADVGELYAFFRNYSKPYADATGAVAGLSARITAGCESDIGKIDSIASWVRQNIRYVAVEHGEYGICPEPAADVFARRYGDCKGSASLLKGLLLEAGIDGRLVWIGTAGEVATRWDSVPSLMSGNHQIAAAVLGDSIIYRRHYDVGACRLYCAVAPRTAGPDRGRRRVYAQDSA